MLYSSRAYRKESSLGHGGPSAPAPAGFRRWFGSGLWAAIGAAVVTSPAAAQLHVPDDFPTLQKAVMAAEDGETILVGPGTYIGSVDLLGKSLTLIGEEGPEKTILDGEDQEISVLVIVGEGKEELSIVTIEGFTITRGQGTVIDKLRRGGAIRAHHVDLSINGCVFTANHDAHRGAAVYAESSMIKVNSTLFADNKTIASGFGGGVYVIDSELEIADSSFIDNRALRGGGLAAVNASGQVNNCDFHENRASSFGGGGGGGIFTEDSAVTISQCTFIENKAIGSGRGGAIHVAGNGEDLIVNCHFERNESSSAGGAIHIESASPTILNCVFLENELPTLPPTWPPTQGGAISTSNGAAPIIEQCHFEANRAHQGGAIFNQSPSLDMQIIGCDFVDNFAAAAGGALTTWEGSHQISNSTFTGNTSGEYGGAMTLFVSPETAITDCQFTENSAAEAGGAILLSASAGTVITNGTFLKHHAMRGGVIKCISSAPNITGCTFDSQSARQGAGIISDDESEPALVGSTFTHSQGEHIVGPWQNLGGNILQPRVSVAVPQQHATIQQAISVVPWGTEIIVAPGTYNEAIDFLGKAITVRGEGGPEETVIDASGLPTSAVTFAQEEPPGTRIEGLTITGGRGTDLGGVLRGGGIYGLFSAPSIDSCVITENAASNPGLTVWGGAMAAVQSRPEVTDSIFISNGNGNAFGTDGIHIQGGDVRFTDCLIELHEKIGLDMNSGTMQFQRVNFHGNGGTAMRLSNVTGVIEDSEFTNNVAHGGPSAMWLGGNITVKRCHITHNLSASGPGAIEIGFQGSGVLITDSIISENQTDGNGGGLHVRTGASPTIRRTLISANEAARGGGVYSWLSASPRFEHCRIMGNSAIDVGGGTYGTSGTNTQLVVTAVCHNEPDQIVGPWTDLGGAIVATDCPPLADIDIDGTVGVDDLLILLSAWGPCPPGYCPADLNGNGEVNALDLLILLSNWG